MRTARVVREGGAQTSMLKTTKQRGAETIAGTKTESPCPFLPQGSFYGTCDTTKRLFITKILSAALTSPSRLTSLCV